MEEMSANIPRLYTAIAEMMSCWIFFVICKRKLSAGKILLLTGGVGLVELAYTRAGTLLSSWFWPIHMLFLFSMMFVYMYCVVERPALTVYYYTMKSFIMAEFVAAFEWQIAYFYKWNEILSGEIRIFIAVLFYTVCFAGLLVVEKIWIRDSIFRTVSVQEGLIATAIVIGVFLLSNIGFFTLNTPFSGQSLSDLFNIRTIVDFLGLVILYAFQSRIAEIDMKMDLATMDQCLREQYEKYRNYQDSIDLINMKYHDLRHQMEDLKEQISSEEQTLLIDNIESELKEYSPYIQTGNKVLDALLDSRQTICRKRNIIITAVADGGLLEFMNVADICTVFGNALDNAVESVTMIEDAEKRLIHLEVTEQKQFVIILVENSCRQGIVFENGIPKSPRKDKKNHGFGTRSIRQVVQKYGGSAIFDAEDGWFTLKILLPCKKSCRKK